MFCGVIFLGLYEHTEKNIKNKLNRYTSSFARPYDGDLDIELISPSGVTVLLTSDNGGTGENYGDPADGTCSSVTNFTMSAATNITAGSAPYIGEFIPEGNLNDFHNNSSPIGLWTLRVCDDASSDFGQLEYIALVFAPANDECADAETLTVQVGTSCASQTNGTTVGATNAGVPNPSCGGSTFKDVWYKLTVPPTGKVIIETSGNGGLVDGGMAVWDACGGTQIACNDDISPGSNLYSRVIIDDIARANTIIYINVWEYYGNAPGTFNICARTPPVENDDSANAITLMQNASCSTTAGISYAASQSIVAHTCTGFTGAADDDVWYKFIATTPNPTIEVASTTDIVIELFESDATTPVTCVDAGNPETINATGLMAGETYFVRVYTYASGNYANFNICIYGEPTPGSNPVAVGTSGSCKAGNTIKSTGSGLWLNIYDGTNVVAAIKDNQNMGNIITNFFVNGTGFLRQDGAGVRYLDRNIAINPTIQPGGNIDVRLYLTQSEFDVLAMADTDITTIADLDLTKVSGGCTGSFSGSGTFVAQTGSGNWGSDYYVDFTISSFSNFFFQNPLGPLPLNLISFNATEKDNGNQLTWITENELEVKQFEVERSINGFKDYGILETILSHSSVTTGSTYSYLDLKPAPKSYYRLKMIDLNGEFNYSKVVVITKKSTELSLRQLFPNPTSNNVNIEVDCPQSIVVDVAIMDVYGKIIQQHTNTCRKGSNRIVLDVTAYAKGCYTLLLTGNNRRITKSFVVQ